MAMAMAMAMAMTIRLILTLLYYLEYQGGLPDMIYDTVAAGTRRNIGLRLKCNLNDLFDFKLGNHDKGDK